MGIEESNQAKVYEKDFGFRIYKIFNNSPLKSLGIKELSDFIIPPKEISESQVTFEGWLKQKINQKIKISIYSLLTRSLKEYEIIINDNAQKEGLLGCDTNYENYISAERKLLHVIKVKKNSFAQDNLFLIENQDYLIGLKTLNDGKYYTLNDDKLKELIIEFIDILNKNKGKNCEFYIYNIKRGTKIVMTKIPNDKSFSLGCDVAYGRIHEFPMKNGGEEDEEKRSLKD